MTILAYVAKFSWTSLFILVWLKAFGYMQDRPDLTWGALIIFGLTALIITFFYIGMEGIQWDRMYPKPNKKNETPSSASES